MNAWDRASLISHHLKPIVEALPQTPTDHDSTTDWPSIQAQEDYWKERDRDLDKIESACAWFDEKDRRLPF